MDWTGGRCLDDKQAHTRKVTWQSVRGEREDSDGRKRILTDVSRDSSSSHADLWSRDSSHEEGGRWYDSKMS